MRGQATFHYAQRTTGNPDQVIVRVAVTLHGTAVDNVANIGITADRDFVVFGVAVEENEPAVDFTTNALAGGDGDAVVLDTAVMRITANDPTIDGDVIGNRDFVILCRAVAESAPYFFIHMGIARQGDGVTVSLAGEGVSAQHKVDLPAGHGDAVVRGIAGVTVAALYSDCPGAAGDRDVAVRGVVAAFAHADIEI